MPKKILIVLFVIVCLVLGVLIWKLEFWKLLIREKESLVLTFVKENLKEEFWPSEVKKEVGKGNSVSASWTINQDNFSVLFEPSDGGGKYNLGIFFPEQKLLNPQTSKEILSSYFVFMPETFTCSAPRIQLKEEIFECRSATENRVINILSFRVLNLDQGGTYISLSVRE